VISVATRREEGEKVVGAMAASSLPPVVIIRRLSTRLCAPSIPRSLRNGWAATNLMPKKTPPQQTAAEPYFFWLGATGFAVRTVGKYPVRVRTVSLPMPLASALTCTRRNPGSVVGLVEW
jgi:hypothetical protein